MRKQTIFAFAIGIGIAGSAGAQVTIGNELYSFLEEGWGHPERSMTVNGGLALGFVLGVSNALNGVQHPDLPVRFCAPSRVTNGQLMDVTLNYLRANPQLRHLPSVVLIARAFADAFPCTR